MSETLAVRVNNAITRERMKGRATDLVTLDVLLDCQEVLRLYGVSQRLDRMEAMIAKLWGPHP